MHSRDKFQVSIVMCVYNRPQMVHRAIESVLGQTYSDWELIVVNDGSTDQTSNVLQEFSKKDSRIRVDFQTRQGPAAARNRGVVQARYDWIAFLDSDDAWEKQKLEAQIDFLRQHSDYQVVQCQEKWIRNGKGVNQKKIHQMLSGYIFEPSLRMCLISVSSVLMSKKIFHGLGGFDIRFPACEDYELWLRLTARYPVGLITERLTLHYGGHADQLSKQYWGMDRFRVRALQKLLKMTNLNPEQSKQAKQVFHEKISILMKGALKKKRIGYYLFLKFKKWNVDRRKVAYA